MLPERFRLPALLACTQSDRLYRSSVALEGGAPLMQQQYRLAPASPAARSGLEHAGRRRPTIAATPALGELLSRLAPQSFTVLEPPELPFTPSAPFIP